MVRIIIAALLALLGAAIPPARAQDAACAGKAVAPSGASTDTLESGGLTRVYNLYIPTGYDAAAPVPLVLSLHGAVSSADEQQEKTGWDAVAERETFVAVYPQGYLPLAFGYRWNAGEPLAGELQAAFRDEAEVDDAAFIGDLLDHLTTTLCIDPARIYVNGFSNGGGMTHHLACVFADRIAAIGTNAGAYTAIPGGCEPARPMPVVTFHGKRDRIVPYDGNSLLGLQGVEAWAADWAARNGCDPTPAPFNATTGAVSAVEYVGCADDASVVVYSIADGGHTWPGGGWAMPLILGSTSTDISATETMWTFFMQHALR